MIKKRQYHIWQYKIDDLYEQDARLMLNFKTSDAINTSETLMYYILNEKIIGREYDDAVEYIDKNGIEEKAEKNFIPVITIETGTRKTIEQTEKLKRLLNEGFYTKTNPEGHFVFIDNVLSGSQNKEFRQMFVLAKYLKPLKEHISLGVEPSKCTISKNLTRNALTTTDVYLIPVHMEKLGICIIPDCEVPVYEDVSMIKPYVRTTEEEKQYQELQQWMQEQDEYKVKKREVKKAINSDNCELWTLAKGNRQIENYKTVYQWKEVARKVKASELENPKGRTLDFIGKYYALYIEEQTDEYSEDETREIPITEWSIGLQLEPNKNHKCTENIFDGMGVVSSRLGRYFEKKLETEFAITGYQLRLPSIKGFFPVVDFHGYFKKHNIEYITDLWGQTHKVKDIDIITTESTFKAKLDVTGVNENGQEKKEWLFSSIDDYKDRLVKYGYDVIGIANFAKPEHDQYRRATYQFWLAMNIDKYDYYAFSNVQGDILHRALSIYRKEEIDWQDLKYLLAFLQLIERENPNQNLEKEASDAIKAIMLNKKMVFDRKVINTIKMVINRKIDDMCRGKFYIKGKYLYVTQDILAFLRYAASEDREHWDYLGLLDKGQFYCGDENAGKKVLARNPIMSFSEITHANFVDYSGEDAEFIRHINNIVQFPLGTEADRLGGLDKDGDEVLVLDTDYNLIDISIEYLQNYNRIINNTKSQYHGQNSLDLLNHKMSEHFNARFPGKGTISIDDYVLRADVQTNDKEKDTAPGRKWNKDNVIDFIISSEDRTGSITNKNTIIENMANYEKNLQGYALPNAIMKDLQGKMIDASKTGCFDQIFIPEVIQRKFSQLPKFMYYKDGNEYGKDSSVTSALDSFIKPMEGLRKYISNIVLDNFKNKISKQGFENIPSLLQNPELDGTKILEVMGKLRFVYDLFITENTNLAAERDNINPYSSNDEEKREREIINRKFKDLYDRTKQTAEAICHCPSLLATAAVRMTYLEDKNVTFAWVVASEGILQNIKMHEDNEKIAIKRVESAGESTFEWLGEHYSGYSYEGKYTIDFADMDMSIPDEYKSKWETDLPDIKDLKITIMNVEKGKTREIAQALLGNTYKLFINDKGYLGVVEGLGIKDKEVLSEGIDLKKYIGQGITIKKVIRADDKQSVIIAEVDILTEQ